jgi:uncharacterized RDD family membrane protein YckC
MVVVLVVVVIVLVRLAVVLVLVRLALIAILVRFAIVVAYYQPSSSRYSGKRITGLRSLRGDLLT